MFCNGKYHAGGLFCLSEISVSFTLVSCWLFFFSPFLSWKEETPCATTATTMEVLHLEEEELAKLPPRGEKTELFTDLYQKGRRLTVGVFFKHKFISKANLKNPEQSVFNSRTQLAKEIKRKSLARQFVNVSSFRKQIWNIQRKVLLVHGLDFQRKQKEVSGKAGFQLKSSGTRVNFCLFSPL